MYVCMYACMQSGLLAECDTQLFGAAIPITAIVSSPIFSLQHCSLLLY